MSKVLITGATGFVGSHLADYLLSLGSYDVYGTSFGDGNSYTKSILKEDHLIPINLLEKDQVNQLVTNIKPSYVIHLAALASPHKSKSDAFNTLSNNMGAQTYLLESLSKLDNPPITLIIGSAEEYGLVENNQTHINENTPLNPCNPYAVSKIAQDFQALQYFNSKNIPTIRLRPFNHTGERQSTAFVLPAFAKQLVEIENGRKQNLEVLGDLEVIRDFTDVKDMVRAYELSLHKCKPGDVYNIGSGTGTKISQILDLVLSNSSQEIKVQKDESKQGLSEIKSLVCDNSKFKNITGWEPEIPLENTVERVVNYFREEFKKENQ